MAGHKQCRRFQECIDDCFTQVIKEPTHVHNLLDILTDKKDLLGNAKAGCNFGCSEHEWWQEGTGQNTGSQS